MPKVLWEDIEEIQREIKGTLTKTAGIEKTCDNCAHNVKNYCSEIRKEVQAQLEKLNDIILRQTNNNGG